MNFSYAINNIAFILFLEVIYLFYVESLQILNPIVFEENRDNSITNLLGQNKNQIKQKVLLISLDGFRWDFQNKTSTPVLDSIIKNGASTEFVVNVFPTSTLPNHQSVVTGLYPENHGMIDNVFMDPRTGLVFNGQSDIEWWNASTPIWTENELQGKKSGVIFWPGYNVKYRNYTVEFLTSDKFVAPYHRNKGEVMTVKDRIRLTTHWLKIPEVTFVALYSEHADEASHNHPPDSDVQKNKEVIENAIKSIDNMVKDIQDGLADANLTDSVNIIMIGDHGLMNTSYKREIKIDKYIDSKTDIRYIGGFTNIFLYTYENVTDNVYEKLKKGSEEEDSHFKVYRKKDLPNYLHIKNSKLLSEIVILPDPGWVITTEKNKIPYLKGPWERGDHGYDITERKMSPGFLAIGPMFRKGFRKKCIKTVDVYSLITYILDLKPHKNDGRFGRVKPLLKDFEEEKPEETTDTSDADPDDPVKCP